MQEPDRSENPSAAPPDRGRRRVLERLGAAFGTLAAAAVGVPIVGTLLSPLFQRRSEEWIDLGPIDRFPVGETLKVDFDHPRARVWDGKTRRRAAYVRRHDTKTFSVLSPNCTHLGCPVAWFRASGLFMCPCHGGVYYEDGARASGPPPRGLYRYPVRIVRGRLNVHGGHVPTLHDTFERPA